MGGVEVVHEGLQTGFPMSPHEEDVVDKAPPYHGLFGLVLKSLCSSLPMKMLAYDGAMRVPIVVPWICR